jgi:hypothetical protein
MGAFNDGLRGCMSAGQSVFLQTARFIGIRTREPTYAILACVVGPEPEEARYALCAWGILSTWAAQSCAMCDSGSGWSLLVAPSSLLLTVQKHLDPATNLSSARTHMLTPRSGADAALSGSSCPLACTGHWIGDAAALVDTSFSTATRSFMAQAGTTTCVTKLSRPRH